MAWLLVAAVVFIIALRYARRRRSAVAPSQSISTFNVVMSKKQTAKTKAALDAATAALR